MPRKIELTSGLRACIGEALARLEGTGAERAEVVWPLGERQPVLLTAEEARAALTQGYIEVPFATVKVDISACRYTWSFEVPVDRIDWSEEDVRPLLARAIRQINAQRGDWLVEIPGLSNAVCPVTCAACGKSIADEEQRFDIRLDWQPSAEGYGSGVILGLCSRSCEVAKLHGLAAEISLGGSASHGPGVGIIFDDELRAPEPHRLAAKPRRDRLGEAVIRAVREMPVPSGLADCSEHEWKVLTADAAGSLERAAERREALDAVHGRGALSHLVETGVRNLPMPIEAADAGATEDVWHEATENAAYRLYHSDEVQQEYPLLKAEVEKLRAQVCDMEEANTLAVKSLAEALDRAELAEVALVRERAEYSAALAELGPPPVGPDGTILGGREATRAFREDMDRLRRERDELHGLLQQRGGELMAAVEDIDRLREERDRLLAERNEACEDAEQWATAATAADRAAKDLARERDERLPLFWVDDHDRWGFSLNVVRAASREEACRLAGASPTSVDVEVVELDPRGEPAVLRCYDESPDTGDGG